MSSTGSPEIDATDCATNVQRRMGYGAAVSIPNQFDGTVVDLVVEWVRKSQVFFLLVLFRCKVHNVLRDVVQEDEGGAPGSFSA